MLLAMALASKREGTWKLAMDTKMVVSKLYLTSSSFPKAAGESSHADRYKWSYGALINGRKKMGIPPGK